MCTWLSINSPANPCHNASLHDVQATIKTIATRPSFKGNRWFLGLNDRNGQTSTIVIACSERRIARFSLNSAYEALAFAGSLAEYIGGQVEIKRLRRWIMPAVNIGLRRGRSLWSWMEDFCHEILERRIVLYEEITRFVREILLLFRVS